MNHQQNVRKSRSRRFRFIRERERHNLVLYILLVIIAFIFIIAVPVQGLPEDDAGPAGIHAPDIRSSRHLPEMRPLPASADPVPESPSRCDRTGAFS